MRQEASWSNRRCEPVENSDLYFADGQFHCRIARVPSEQRTRGLRRKKISQSHAAAPVLGGTRLSNCSSIFSQSRVEREKKLRPTSRVELQKNRARDYHGPSCPYDARNSSTCIHGPDKPVEQSQLRECFKVAINLIVQGDEGKTGKWLC
jgi:hypothetical protein